MPEISGHNPDFNYIIALNRLMTCLFPLNSGNLSFRDSVGRAKPNGMRGGANERREVREWTKTPTAMPNAIGCVAVFFFSGVAISFPLFLVPLSFTFEL